MSVRDHAYVDGAVVRDGEYLLERIEQFRRER